MDKGAETPTVEAARAEGDEETRIHTTEETEGTEAESRGENRGSGEHTNVNMIAEKEEETETVAYVHFRGDGSCE